RADPLRCESVALAIVLLADHDAAAVAVPLGDDRRQGAHIPDAPYPKPHELLTARAADIGELDVGGVIRRWDADYPFVAPQICGGREAAELGSVRHLTEGRLLDLGAGDCVVPDLLRRHRAVLDLVGADLRGGPGATARQHAEDGERGHHVRVSQVRPDAVHLLLLLQSSALASSLDPRQT